MNRRRRRNCRKDGEETHQYRDTNLVYNYKGTVWYVEADGSRTELLYRGYDKSTDSLRYGFKSQKKDNRIFRIRYKYEETGSRECIEKGQKPGVFVIVGYKKECFDGMKGYSEINSVKM